MGMTLTLGPGEDCLKYHNELHRYARVVQTLGTFQLVLGDVQHQVHAGKKGVCLDGALALLNGLKLAQSVGVLPQARAQCRLSLFKVRDCGSSSLFQSRRDSIQRDGLIGLECRGVRVCRERRI